MTVTLPVIWLIIIVLAAAALATFVYAIRGKGMLALLGLELIGIGVLFYFIDAAVLTVVCVIAGLGCLVTVAEHMARRLR